MLDTICDDTWNVINMQHITQIQKDGIIQTLPVVAIKRFKEPANMVEGGHHLPWCQISKVRYLATNTMAGDSYTWDS